MQLKKKQTNKQAKDFNSLSSKEDIEIANKHKEKMSDITSH